MPIATPTFLRVAGTPATPQFCEYLLRSNITESDGSVQALVNIFHFFRSGGPGTSTEAAFAAAVQAIWTPANWAAFYNGDVANAFVSTRFMDDPTRLAVISAGMGAGAVGGSRSASFVSTVMRKLGYARGRYWRGSNHMGPVPETMYDKDQLNALGLLTYSVNLIVPFNNLALPFAVGADTWQLCVLSTTQCDLIANPSIFSGSLVSSCTLNVKLGTMKRRKQNVGI